VPSAEFGDLSAMSLVRLDRDLVEGLADGWIGGDELADRQAMRAELMTELGIDAACRPVLD
jgi:hypothetical protein